MGTAVHLHVFGSYVERQRKRGSFVCFSMVSVIVWVGAAVVTISGPLLGGKLYVYLPVVLRRVLSLYCRQHTN